MNAAERVLLVWAYVVVGGLAAVTLVVLVGLALDFHRAGRRRLSRAAHRERARVLEDVRRMNDAAVPEQRRG